MANSNVLNEEAAIYYVIAIDSKAQCRLSLVSFFIGKAIILTVPHLFDEKILDD